MKEKKRAAGLETRRSFPFLKVKEVNGAATTSRHASSPLMTTDPPPKVSKDLANAVQDDWRRSVRDSAKHRAVAQMESYDGFKNMVSVAHLRPYHAPNFKEHGVVNPPAFGFTADGVPSGPVANPGSISSGGVGGSSDEMSGSCSTQFEKPENSMRFDKTWRKACKSPALKWHYLGVCGGDSLQKVFAKDIGGMVLGEIVEALADGFGVVCRTDEADEDDDTIEKEKKDASKRKETETESSSAADSWQGAGTTDIAAIAVNVMATLRALTKCGRFDLARRLLNKQQKGKLEILMTALEKVSGVDAERDALRDAYLG